MLFRSWPGWHISGDWPSAGFQAYYPSAKTRVSTAVFLKKAAAAVQLSNTLMTKDVIALAPAWGYLQTAAATLEPEDAKGNAGEARAQLGRDFDAVFAAVKEARYDAAKAALPAMNADAEKLLTPKAAEKVKTAAAEAAKWADRGMAWKARGLMRQAAN